MAHDKNVTRRAVLRSAGATVAGAALPTCSLPATAAAPSSRLASLPPPVPYVGSVELCRRLLERATAVYEVTGDPEELKEARFIIYWKMSYVMGIIPQRERETLNQIEGFRLLELAALSCPEVPWTHDIAAALRTYRMRGCAEGRTLNGALW